MKTAKSIIKRIFWGLFFLAAATLVALQTFGVIELSLGVGTVLLLALLAAIAIGSLVKFFWFGVFMPAALAILLLSQASILPALTDTQTGMLFLIAALISIGFHILFHTRKFSCPPEAETETSFGSTSKSFAEKDFESTSLECNFGSIKADFSETKLKSKTATIHLECNFGGIELHLPKNWRIEQNIENAFAGVKEQNRPTLTESSPTVTLTGECNFGGITILYV